MFENWIILKNEAAAKADEYARAADWCNASGAFAIFENDESYFVAALPPVEKVEEEGTDNDNS